MLTEKQDREIFRDVFEYYQKYKNPQNIKSEVVWQAWDFEGNYLLKKHKNNHLFSRLLIAVQGEINRNCQECINAETEQNQIELED